MVDDTADSASLGVLNRGDLTNTVEADFSDLIGEVSGALINAADELAAEAVEEGTMNLPAVEEFGVSRRFESDLPP